MYKMCEVIEFYKLSKKEIFDKKLKEFNNFKRMEFEDIELTLQEQKRYDNVHKWIILHQDNWLN
jgi:hypothetical protein